VILAHARVQVLAHSLHELVKGFLSLGVGRVQQGTDSELVAFSDVSNVLGPAFPIAPVSALVDDLGKDGALPLAQFFRVEGKADLFLCDTVSFVVAAANANDVDYSIGLAHDVDLSELLIQAIIVCAKRV